MIGMTDEKNKQNNYMQYSKKLIRDIRTLLWIITITCIGLAYYVVYVGYQGAIEWIALICSSSWAAHGVVCSIYLQKSKKEHSEGGTDYLRLQADIEHEKNLMMGAYNNATSDDEDCGMPQF